MSEANTNSNNNNNNNNNFNENEYPSQLGFYSEDGDFAVYPILEEAQEKGWYWPQVYFYIVDELKNEFPEVEDTTVRDSIYVKFFEEYNGKGEDINHYEYEDTFHTTGLYRNYMTVPLNEVAHQQLLNNPEVELEYKTLPRNAINEIYMNPIEEGERMVNFHNEFDRGRFYRRTTYNSMNPKLNPFTRQVIIPENVVQYRAHLEGGKRRKRTNRKKTSRRMKRKSTRQMNRKSTRK